MDYQYHQHRSAAAAAAAYQGYHQYTTAGTAAAAESANHLKVGRKKQWLFCPFLLETQRNATAI